MGISLVRLVPAPRSRKSVNQSSTMTQIQLFDAVKATGLKIRPFDYVKEEMPLI